MLTIVAAGIVAAAVLAVILLTRPAPPGTAAGPAAPSGRAFVDHHAELGLDGAGQHLARALGQVRAQQIAADMARAAAILNPPGSFGNPIPIPPGPAIPPPAPSPSPPAPAAVPNP